MNLVCVASVIVMAAQDAIVQDDGNQTRFKELIARLEDEAISSLNRV